MNANAVPQAGCKSRLILAALAAAAMLLAALGATASAAPLVGKDGKIHACYRVKGKPKGSLRVVPAKKHCRRGERKVAWSAVGSSGQAGTTGAAGANGQAGGGQAGTNGSDGSSEAALKTQIAGLTLKVESLENTLKGVTNGDLLGTLSTVDGLDNEELLGAVDAVKGLTNNELLDSVDALKGLTNGDLKGAVDTVQGLTNAELTEAVGTLPAVDALCTQATGLTQQVNTVSKGLTTETALAGILPPGLGLSLPTIPPLAGFACP